MKYTLFGESHGKSIGIVLENVPSGLELDFDFINKELQRRSAKKFTSISTSRHEEDKFQVVSGFKNGFTTGAPLCALIENNDVQSEDYKKNPFLARPSHADYAAHIRYNGHNDFRGGGHFSGRLTAPLVFAGAVAKQFLAKYKIEVLSRVREIASICDSEFNNANINMIKLREIASKDFPTIDEQCGKLMQEKIINAKASNNSLGGIIEVFCCGLEAGFGGPGIDENLEGLIAKAVFAVPAVKGIEFGAGFNLAKMRGNEANDNWFNQDGKVYSNTNHNGGINGGISNGMPIHFSVVIKPTSSIGLEQSTIDLNTNLEKNIIIEGRHDPCIVPRAVVVLESVTALAISKLFENNYA